MRSEAARMLHEFLVALPEEQRLVFVLYEMDGANANEIAEAVGISRNTVHSRVRLIREKLARFVGRERAKEKRSDG
jgi:RNA polymerase sigma-70 factor (ECF subfamily)